MRKPLNKWVLLAVLLLSGRRAEAHTGRAAPPRVAAQVWIYMQHFQQRDASLLDNLDEAAAGIAGAGFPAMQGWLDWFATAKSARQVAATLTRHKLAMPSAYVGGRLHDEQGAATITRILARARRARTLGLRVVVMNPDVLDDGADKSDEQLATQARHLDRLGQGLARLGLRLAVHAHDREMRANAREWHHILRHTDARQVGLCLDVDWVQRGGQDPLQLLGVAGERVIDLHLRNTRDGVWTEALGDGDIDYRAIAEALRARGYRGSYTVELSHEGSTVRTTTIAENLARSRAYVKAVFGE